MTSAAPDIDQLTPGARRILTTAAALFYDRGIHSVGVDTIAEKSGVTKRTLYNNFGSKDTLVVTYLEARHHTWWGRLERRIEAAEPPRALTLFDVYAEDTLTATRGCAFLNAAAELPDDHPGYAIIRHHKQAIEDLLRRVISADDPTASADRLARHMFLLLEGAFAHQGIHGPDLLSEAREIARDLLEP